MAFGVKGGVKRRMKVKIWMEVQCARCDLIAGRNYRSKKSVYELKEFTKDWIFDKQYGNLCPECQKAIKERTKVDER